MAKDIELKIKIDTGQASQNVGKVVDEMTRLKKETKAAMSDAIKGVAGASERVAELKDKMEDLNEATNSLKGSGIEKLNSSLGLLKEGFVNADPGKLGAGFKVLGLAMKAIPIFLLIEGIKYVIENFEKLTQSGGLIGKVFGFIKDVIDTVIQAFKDLTDWLGITNNAIEDNAEKTIEASKKAGAAVTQRYDDEIKLANAAGKDVTTLEIKKQEAVIETARVQVNALKAVYEANGTLTKAQMEQLETLVTTIHNAEVEIKAKTIANEKKTSDEKVKINKEYNDEHKKIEEDKLKESGKAWMAELKAKEEAEDAKIELEEKSSLESYRIEQERIKLSGEAWMAKLKAKEKAEDDRITKEESDSLKSVQDAKNRQDSMFEIAKTSNDSLIALSDLFFSVKMANTRKGSAEEEKAARQQFKINKALAIQSAVISGIQGVVNALSAQSVVPEPFGTILKVATAVSVGIAAATNVAKIAATQFTLNGGGESSGVAVPASPSSASPNASGAFTGNELQKIGSTNSSSTINKPSKVYVISQDLTNQQNSDAVLERRANFTP